MANKKKKDLVQIIRDNPGSIATIDKDCWRLEKDTPKPEGFDDWSLAKQDKWYEKNTLATSDDDLIDLGEGYGTGNCYGGDILQALAVIVGIKVESV